MSLARGPFPLVAAGTTLTVLAAAAALESLSFRTAGWLPAGEPFSVAVALCAFVVATLVLVRGGVALLAVRGRENRR
jgi:hypothetical protein